MPLSPLTPSPQESAVSGAFLALLAKNGSLPTELKFKENIVNVVRD